MIKLIHTRHLKTNILIVNKRREAEQLIKEFQMDLSKWYHEIAKKIMEIRR